MTLRAYCLESSCIFFKRKKSGMAVSSFFNYSFINHDETPDDVKRMSSIKIKHTWNFFFQQYASKGKNNCLAFLTFQYLFFRKDGRIKHSYFFPRKYFSVIASE